MTSVARPLDRTNDGSTRAPRLCRALNLGTLLPQAEPASTAPTNPHIAPSDNPPVNPPVNPFEAALALRCEAVQDWYVPPAASVAGLRATGQARIAHEADADRVAREHRDRGHDATTLHLGTGFENDAQADRLAGAVLEAQARYGHRLYVETHRATATQDIWRTLRLVERFPDLRFNADLSHWYCSHELTYAGEFDTRAAHLAPVLERVRFIHGRVASAGCIQVPLDYPGPQLGHFERLWRHCFRSFLAGATPGDYLSFAVELLPAYIDHQGERTWIHYATLERRGGTAFETEVSTRWAEAQRLLALAEQWFAEERG